MCFSVAITNDIQDLSNRFKARIDTNSYADFVAQKEKETLLDKKNRKEIFGLKKATDQTLYKISGEDKRIYPGYFTHVLRSLKNERVFEPMRYRVRPKGSQEEIPSKFNVFNARIDSLEIRKTWKPLFLKNHGLFAFNKFYEWVDFLPPGYEREEKPLKRLISFFPKETDLMWAPCLWDEWTSPNGKFHFKSFAIITDEPPKEVLEMGHDRCPIFLDENFIDQWLDPSQLDRENVYELLKNKTKVTYDHQWVENA